MCLWICGILAYIVSVSHSSLTVIIHNMGDVYRSGCVNGMQVGDIILDTGASRTLVRGDLVPTHAMLEEEVTIRCAHGDAITYPLAQVTISVGPHQESL